MVKWLKITQGSVSMLVVGNFDVVSQSASVIFPFGGIWYDYFNTGTINATAASQNISLAPGAYRVYLNQFVALPVSILSFTGKSADGMNALNWVVNNEQEVLSYQLERSLNAKDFINVAELTANNSRQYNYVDDVSGNQAAVYFYRIKITDRDGSFRYSEVIQLKQKQTDDLIKVSPNPFKNKINIDITTTQTTAAILSIIDINGRKVKVMNRLLSVGNNNLIFENLSDLQNGVYTLLIATKKNLEAIKIVKHN
jgi:hypothetical protein